MSATAEEVVQRPASVGQMFLDRVEASPDREAYRYPDGNGWTSVTWTQMRDRVWEVGGGLLALGIELEQRVAIASSTRFEWLLADLAINCVGAASTTVYPTTKPDDVAYILSDSQSRIIFAENDEQVAKVLEHRAELPYLDTVVVFDGDPIGDDVVITLDQLCQRGRDYLAENPGAIEVAVGKIEPEHLATLIYTSGTTGRPKGVRLVNDNWTYEGVAVDQLGILGPDDLQYLWLPLSHVLGKMLGAMQLRIGFTTAVDGNIDRIVENLGVIKPTFMGAPPRIYEKVRARVSGSVEAEGGIKAKLFRWAFGVGLRASRLRQAGKRVPGLLAVQLKIADALVFRKIKERMGGRIRYFISGSAPLSRDVAEWFDAAGLVILEGYGLTETSAAFTVNRPGATRIGTVGPPLPGSEVAIAEDGEVLVRGGSVMRGYHNRPEETAEVLTDDGWLGTGDIGTLDADGYLRITDRKKDLIKTSGGKYVAPQKVEIQFMAECPYASQIIVHGNQRQYITALVALDPDALREWAETHDLGRLTYEELVAAPEVRDMVQQYIDQVNARLERWETVKKFEILPAALAVEAGEVTPSMKVRRRAVEERYQDLLEGMYT
ncbi:MAG TPA: long-chain fatty acid--CoA ligase [Jiangellaceae bacterium]|nr:long-chain fatty acid--CoA ligase [Jiangellaceae bacterium]